MKPAVIAVISILSACATQRDSVAIRTTSLRSGVCTLHHVPLREATVYEFAPLRPATLDPGMGAELHEKYPNSLPVEYEFKKSKFNRKPVRYRYCPACQHAYDTELQEASTKAMREWEREHHI
jgi:hypothetical protein